MSKHVQFEGQDHVFPDDFTDADIQKALGSLPGGPKPPSPEIGGASAAAQAYGNILGAVNPVLGFLRVPEFGGGAVKGAEHTALTVADLAQRGAARTVGLQAPSLMDRPDLRAATTPTTPKEKLGYGAEQFGEFFVPTPFSKIKAAANASRLTRFGLTTLREALDVGAKTAAQTGDPERAGWAAAVGGLLGGTVEVAAPYIGGLLKDWAQEQYGRFMHPLGRYAKEVAQEQVPRVVEEGYRKAAGVTLKGIAKKFDKRVADLGAQLDQEYRALDQTTRTRLQPIYTDFYNWVKKEAYTKIGTVKDETLREKALEKLLEVQRSFRKFARDSEPSVVWEVRKTLDKYVFKNGLTADKSVAAANQVNDAMGNIIRNQLNKQHPSIGVLNNEFHMVRATAELIHRNINNEFGKRQFASRTWALLRGGMGASIFGGAAYHGGAGWASGVWAAAGATALATLGKVFDTTAWQTVAAVTKNKIGDLLVKGNAEAAANLAARAVGMVASATHTEPPPKQTGAATPSGQTSAANVPSAAVPTSGLAVKPGDVVQATPPTWSLAPAQAGPPRSDDRPSAFEPVRRVGEAPPRPATLVPVSPAAPELESTGVPRTSPIVGTPPQRTPAPQPARPQAAAPRGGRYEAWDRTKEWMSDFQKFGSLYGVPPAIIRAVMHNESHGDPNIQPGSSGEIGIMQLMPGTAKRLVDPVTGRKGIDRSNPHESVRGATILLSQLWKKYHGDKRKVLAAYNEGETIFDKRLKRWGDKVWDHLPKITRDYVHNGLWVLGGGGD